ncbi:hypothetical protein AMTRI_Chr09g37280 [Amborella trichopoda]
MPLLDLVSISSTLTFRAPSLGSAMPLLLLLSESESGTCIILDMGHMSLSRTSLSSKGSASTFLSSKESMPMALVGLLQRTLFLACRRRG